MSAPIATTVTDIVAAPVEVAFDHIVPVDLTTVFTGYRLLPGVRHTTITKGWTTPGLVRTVTFTDGSRSTETLLSVTRPTAFSYRNDGFTSPLRLLVARVEGRWTFAPAGPGRTRIEWTYALFPKHAVAAWVIRAGVIGMIHGMLAEALARMKERLETGQRAGAAA